MKCQIFLVAGLGAASCTEDPILSPESAEKAITEENLRSTLNDFYKIALDNNNNRAFGFPGYDASVNYVLARVAELTPNITVSLQNFTSIWEHTQSISLRVAGSNDSVQVISPQFNNPTPLPGGITEPLAAVPEDGAGGPGCSEDQYRGLEEQGKGVRGKFALVKKGGCNFPAKARLATQFGAVGLIIYNNAPGTSYFASTLLDGIGKFVPTGMTTLEVGNAWMIKLAANESVVVTFTVDSISGQRESQNVFVETVGGDPDNVVMLGAHLDSVQAGPGINDNGSGSAAMLEILKLIASAGGKGCKGEVKNKVRFVWWGAEEAGLVGSHFYTGGLSQAEADKIRFYFNYDMIGSLRPIYMVAKNAANAPVADTMAKFIESKGKRIIYQDPTSAAASGFDWAGFNDLGIPVSGGFTGQEDAQDPCYHRACDTIDNINWEALTIFAKAGGLVAVQLAQSLEGIPPRNRTAVATSFQDLDD